VRTSRHALFRAEARQKILDGVTIVADAVRVTSGPRPKRVLIEKKYGRPLVCNDGESVIHPSDAYWDAEKEARHHEGFSEE
jgi:chaperonin GroEL